MANQIHDTDYLFLTTRVRALECQLLDRGQMEQMLEAATPQEAARLLTDCGYPELDPVNGETLGAMLAREREKTFQDLGELVPDPAVLAVFQVQHDYHNLKVLLKSEAMGLDGDRLLVDTGRVPGEAMAAAVRSGELGDLPGLLPEAVGEARQVLAATRDPQLGDFILDRYAFRELENLSRQTGSAFLAGYVQRTTDVANLRTSGNRYGIGKERYNAVTLQVGKEPDDTYCLKIFNSGTDTAYFNKIHPGDRVKVQVATGRFGVKYVVGERILGVWRPEAKPAMRRLGAVKDTVRIIADTLDVRNLLAGTIERRLAMGCHATIDGEPAETLYDEKALSSALQAAAKAGSTVELHRPMGDGKVEVWAIRGKQEWTKPSYDEPTLSDITYALKRGKATLLIGGNEAQPDPRAINAALDKHRPVCLRFATSTGARTRYRFMPLD